VTEPSQESRLILRSVMEEVPRAKDPIVAAARQFGFSEKDVFAITLALDEVLTNAIRHGNKRDPAKQVFVNYQVNRQSLRVTVCDEGAGFQARQVPDPTLDENLDKPGGRGVMLLRNCMNEVIYNEQGNCVTLVKWNPGADPDA